MPAKQEYTPEFKEQAVRFVLEEMEPDESRKHACDRLAPRLSVKARPPGEQHRRRRDPLIDVRPRSRRTQRLPATQAVLAPRQPCRPTEARQIHQLHHRSILHPRPAAAPGAPHLLEASLDVNHERAPRAVLDRGHDDIRQADQQLAHARRVELQQGLQGLDGVGTTDSWSPCPANRGPSPTPTHPAQIRRASYVRAAATSPRCRACASRSSPLSRGRIVRGQPWVRCGDGAGGFRWRR